MTHCPTCHSKLVRCDKFFPPAVVLRCKSCRKFCIEDVANSWVEGGPDAMDKLRRLAAGQQILLSDDDDPRWR